jgi:uridine kinase
MPSSSVAATTILPIITIGIAGGTGAGKTTLAQKLYTALGGEWNVTYLIHDAYYHDLQHLSYEQRQNINFDHPSSLDTDLLLHHVQQLKAGHAIDIPLYDFTTHSRRTNQTMTCVPRKINGRDTYFLSSRISTTNGY